MKKNRKALKITALVIALVLLAGLGSFANALLGNPVSKHLAQKSADAYLEEYYAGTDYQVESVNFNFKDGNYHAQITSPSRIDAYFSLSIDMRGRVFYDSIEEYSSGFNTWKRLDWEYRELGDTVLNSPGFPYSAHIDFLTLEHLDRSQLEPDKNYDIRELGREYGKLVLYVDDDTVTEARAAEILLDVRRLMDESGIPFRTVDFVLQHPRPEDSDSPRENGEINLLEFPCEDIYEEDMKERVREVHQATLDYYAEMDAQNQKDMENPQSIDT